MDKFAKATNSYYKVTNRDIPKNIPSVLKEKPYYDFLKSDSEQGIGKRYTR